MFGYIRAYKPEMRIKEYELYKSVYCSLCKELGKSYGVLARMTLSYDFTFLALVSMSLSEEDCSFKRKNCTCNPFKKCNYIQNTTNLEYCSAAAMILLYYKTLDNISDEKGIKRLCYLLAKPLFASAYKKASSKYVELDKSVSDYILAQDSVETSGVDDIDLAAEPTAECMSKVFSAISDDEVTKRCLEQMGYLIGRYIYIVDAACDLEDDIRRGRYNPLKSRANEENLVEEYILPQLNICIAEISKAYELLDIKKFKNILDNIIYLGLEDTYKKELKV